MLGQIQPKLKRSLHPQCLPRKLSHRLNLKCLLLNQRNLCHNSKVKSRHSNHSSNSSNSNSLRVSNHKHQHHLPKANQECLLHSSHLVQRSSSPFSSHKKHNSHKHSSSHHKRLRRLQLQLQLNLNLRPRLRLRFNPSLRHKLRLKLKLSHLILRPKLSPNRPKLKLSLRLKFRARLKLKLNLRPKLSLNHLSRINSQHNPHYRPNKSSKYQPSSLSNSKLLLRQKFHNKLLFRNNLSQLQQKHPSQLCLSNPSDP